MKRLVADTHAFLWHLYHPARLGKAAQEAFNATDAGKCTIFLPALVIAEALMVAQKQRIPSITLPGLVTQLKLIQQNRSFYMPTALQPDVVLASRTLTAIPDIFDRLIVAEAIDRGLPLITRDSTIVESGLVDVVWA